MKIQLNINKQIESILKTLYTGKFEAYIAGGAVRDILSGIDPADIDIVTNAKPDEITALFQGEKVTIAGKAFNVCFVNHIEISTYRMGGYSNNSSHLVFADNLQDDLKRRDLTINSMAFCPLSEKLIDYYHGFNDLKNRIIKLTENPVDRIIEDPCRIIRACRFLAKIEGKFEAKTFKAMCKQKELTVTQTAPERIRIEILKAMTYKKPSIFFNALHDIGLLKDIFPSLDRCYSLDGGPFHNETVFEHCMLTGDAITCKNPILRLAGYLHDTSKADAISYKNGRLSFAGHEKKNNAVFADLKKLRFSTVEQIYIKNIIEIHMLPFNDKSTPKAARKLISYLNRINISYTDFFRMRIADRKSNKAKPPYTISEIKIRLNKILNELNTENNQAFTIKDLAVSGNDIINFIKIAPGPEIGKILKKLLELVLDDPKLNNREKLLEISKNMLKNIVTVHDQEM